MNSADTLACAHDDDLIARAALGLLAPQEEPGLARRLADCPTCRARLDECRALAAAVAALDPHPAPIALTAVPRHVRSAARSPSELAGEEVGPVGPTRTPRGSTRHRHEGWYVAAALLLVAGMAAFIFNTFAGARLAKGPHATASVAATATPIPPTVVITSNVNFGTLTVNGHTLTGAPPLVTHHLFHAAAAGAPLLDGENVVTLSAPPFRPHTCRIDWVAGEATVAGDPAAVGALTCNVGGRDSYLIGGAPVWADLEVTVLVDGSDLPPALAVSAAAVLTQALAAVQVPTTVPTGQYYATGLDPQGRIVARRAPTPLAAAAVFSMPPLGPSNSICGWCGATWEPGLALPAGPPIWAVSVDLTVTWHYQAPSGGVTVALPSPYARRYFAVLVLLAYHAAPAAPAAPSWSVVTPPPVPAPAQGPPVTPRLADLPDQLTQGLCQGGLALVDWLGWAQGHDLNGYASVPTDRGVEGCLIQLLNGTSTAVQGTFLWRFGVLLAVDQGALTLAPWLPLAPQAEVAAVEV